MLTDISGTLFFCDSSALWKTDGTNVGTVLIKNFYNEWINTNCLHNYNGKVLYADRNSAYGNEYLYQSDGTPNGTVEVSTRTIDPGQFYDYNGAVFFIGYDSSSYNSNPNPLSKTTGNGITKVTKKQMNVASNYYPSDAFATLNNTLYFGATDTSTQNTIWLWKSDGTDKGTVPVVELNAITSKLVSVGKMIVNTSTNQFYFWTDDGVHGYELWISDGTAAGTHMVKDINTGVGSAIFFDTDIPSFYNSPNNMLLFNNTLYFEANGRRTRR